MPKSRPKSRPMRREWRNCTTAMDAMGQQVNIGELWNIVKLCKTPSCYIFGTLHDHYMIITCRSCISFGYYIIWIICHVSYEVSSWPGVGNDLASASWNTTLADNGWPQRPQPSDCILTCLTCTSWYILYILIISDHITLSSSDIRVKETRNHTKPWGPRKM